MGTHALVMNFCSSMSSLATLLQTCTDLISCFSTFSRAARCCTGLFYATLFAVSSAASTPLVTAAATKLLQLCGSSATYPRPSKLLQLCGSSAIYSRPSDSSVRHNLCARQKKKNVNQKNEKKKKENNPFPAVV